MDPEDDDLYRGTTVGWAGSRTSLLLPMTCTSVDPYVATCFALDSAQFGESVVQVARRSDLQGVVESSNFFGEFEDAVNLAILPLDFLDWVVLTIPVEIARDVLRSMGFEQIPYLINGRAMLQEELIQSRQRGDRLTQQQKQVFKQLVEEELRAKKIL